jgi:hypothetical protein
LLHCYTMAVVTEAALEFIELAVGRWFLPLSHPCSCILFVSRVCQCQVDMLSKCGLNP